MDADKVVFLSFVLPDKQTNESRDIIRTVGLIHLNQVAVLISRQLSDLIRRGCWPGSTFVFR